MDPNNPSGVKPMAPMGDVTDESIFVEVGRALSDWESLELEMSFLYEALLNADGDGAAAGYGRLEAFRSRSALLEEADKNCPFRNEPPFRQTRTLCKRVTDLASRRNEIAHGVVAEVHGRGFYLVPAWYNTNKAPRQGTGPKYNGGIGTYAYTSEQIGQYDAQFKILRTEAFGLRRAVLRRWGREDP